ncbi:MAG: BACON domain-containing protein [Ignavibacteriae bacterium]|nr:BACON domain-containing protein [Ignavibacteriota bacterium]
MKNLLLDSLLIFILILFIDIKSQSVSKQGGICFRTDDNQPINMYLEYAEVFDKYDKEFTFALNLAMQEITSDYISKIKTIQSNGHEMMDHTPFHRTNYFHTILGSDFYKNHPGVANIKDNKIELSYVKITEDYAKANYERTGYVDINGNYIISNIGQFKEFKKTDCYLYFPTLDKLVFIDENTGWIDNYKVQIRGFWRNDENLGITKNLKFYNLDINDVHLTPQALNALMKESLRLAEHYNLIRPYTWIQPGGYFPHVYREEIKEGCQTSLAYKAAGVFSNPSLKVFNEFDPNKDKQYGMNFGDFREDIWSLEKCKNFIANRIAKHHVVIGHSHFRELLGGWSGFLERTEKLIQWCIENDIPIRTYSQWADVLYNQIPNPNENIFPSLNIDKDKNNLPDGFEKFTDSYIDMTDGISQDENLSLAINKKGTIAKIIDLAGLEKGKNSFELWTKGATGNFIEIDFQVGSNNQIFKIPAESSIWTKYTLQNSTNGNTSLIIPENISLINVTIRSTNFSSGTTKICGMKMSKENINLPEIELSKNSDILEATSKSTSFSITSNVSWKAESNSSWLTVSPSSGNNNGTITASFSENTNSSPRNAIITVSGGGISKTISITQNGKPSSGGETGNYINIPETLSLGRDAGSTTVNVNSNITWTVKDNTGSVGGWISKSPKSLTGNGTITVRYLANNTGKDRIGQLIFLIVVLQKLLTFFNLLRPLYQVSIHFR